MGGTVVHEQVKGKILAERISVHTEQAKHSKSRGGFLRRVKEQDRRKKEAKEKGRSPVHRKSQPPCA